MRVKRYAPPRFPRRVKTEGDKIATGSPAAHICGRGGIGRLDGFRFRYLSGVRVRVPPPAPYRVFITDLSYGHSISYGSTRVKQKSGALLATSCIESCYILGYNENICLSQAEMSI